MSHKTKRNITIALIIGVCYLIFYIFLFSIPEFRDGFRDGFRNSYSEAYKQNQNNDTVLSITIIASIAIAIIIFIILARSRRSHTTSTPTPTHTTTTTPAPTRSSGYSSAFLCPYCYSVHRVSDCNMKCLLTVNTTSYQRCNNGVQIDRNGWIPKDDHHRCLNCTMAATQIFCDIYSDKEIPSEFLHMNGLPIALLGAKATGKSNYIGVLIEEILHKMSGPFNCSLSKASSKESKDAFEQYYYRPLYRDGHTVLATDAGVEIPPLIFPIRFMNKKFDIVNSVTLTLYDTAGENLDDITEMHRINRYIANAHCIILLLDPLQVPQVRDTLTAKGFTDLPALNTDAIDVLDTITKVIRDIKKVKNQIDIPIALVFTKIDVLEKYGILPPDSCLLTESEHIAQGMFVLQDFENTHIQMEALIDNWLKGAILSYIRQFRNYAFFGVSALGANPDGNTLTAKIHPRRVLDPLLWLLARENYIKTLK